MQPQYGSRLMPVVLDTIAQQDSDLTFASIAKGSNVSDGFKDIKFADIATAANHVASWIDVTLGKSENFATLAYIGPGDLRYVVVFLAAVKCGYKVLLPSPRNAPWMNVSLLDQTSCTHILYAAEVEPLIQPLCTSSPDLQAHKIASLDELIASKAQHYPYEKDYSAAKWDPILVLHSSGSTGPPRPIIMNHATFAVGDHDRLLPTVPGRVNQNWSLWDFSEKAPFFSPFPAFHLAGFSSMVMLPIYYPNATLVLGPASRPPTGHLLAEIMQTFSLKSIFCPPILAEQLVQEPGALERCKDMKFILYAGGPLSKATGDALSRMTDVCQFYGQTETGAIQALVPRREDWASLEWHPAQEAVMEPYLDGKFEMTLLRNPALESVRNVSCNFPDVEVWRTKDLFEPHPSKEGLWTFSGRVDDIVVLSNGEKFNPVPMEIGVAAHPLVAGALVMGQGRAQAALVLELKDAVATSEEEENVLAKIWPTIESANAVAQAHAKITRDMVLLGKAEKPFDRAAKGTVIRGSTAKKYEREVSGLYTRQVSKNFQGMRLDKNPVLGDVVDFLKAAVASAFPSQPVSPEDDLFVLGVDSLQATEIVSIIRTVVGSPETSASSSWVNVRLIYENPTISALAGAILSHLRTTNGGAQGNESHATPDQTSREARAVEMVKRYSQDFPMPVPRKEPTTYEQHVLLTGSTGSLGTQLLRVFLLDPAIKSITCFDRSATAKDRFNKYLRASRMPSPPSLDKVAFHQADFGATDFGISEATLQDLKQRTNVIVHCAWEVNFNHSLASFEAVHIRGVRNLIDFSLTAPTRPRIIFISSISSMTNWKPDSQTTDPEQPVLIPEEVPRTPGCAQAMGYAESKAVAEQILRAASEKTGLPTCIVRTGQIGGPVGESNAASWNADEWFPLLLRSSKALGRIPSDSAFGDVDWVPSDVVARIIHDFAASATSTTSESPCAVYNLLNPHPRPWKDLLPTMQKRLGDARAISMSEWVQEIKKLSTGQNGSTASLVEQVPAAKILHFFEEMKESEYGSGMSLPDTRAGRSASKTFEGLGPVTDEWVRKWMEDMGL